MAYSLGVFVAFSAGLFSFLSPCVLPLFPSYLSFITGRSVTTLTEDVTAATRRRILLHSPAFVVCFTIMFAALGASSCAAGRFLFNYRDWVRVGRALIIVFGLYIAGAAFRLHASCQHARQVRDLRSTSRSLSRC